jgi:replicative DNA helicase
MTLAPGKPPTPAVPPPAGTAPPHSIEAEQAVLGAILLSEKAHYTFVVDEQLKASDFYRERHRVVFATMERLLRDGTAIDVLSVTEALRAEAVLEDAGGADEVAALVTAVPAVGNLRRYAEIVRELSHLRRLLDASYQIQASVFGRDGEPAEIVEQAERTILEIRMGGEGQDFKGVGDVLHAEIERWQALQKSGTTLTGVPSGFPDLDTITGGFQPGNLIIIAARPSMGKSALVTNIAENLALHKDEPRPVALFSLEMSEGELAQRFIASQASIKGDDLRKGRVRGDTWGRVLRAANDYERSQLYIDDSSDMSLLDIRAKARRLHASLRDHGGLGLIIIDYLQLMRADTRYDSRVQQVGEMSRGLKILARELEVPVIALSQLSRGVESRTDKRPMLSDLRESGQIEQDADLVMFIYRDEYYTKDESDDPGVSEILIAKHRNGGLGEVRLAFQNQYPRFLPLEREAAAA